MCAGLQIDWSDLEGRYPLPNDLKIEIYSKDRVFYGKIIDATEFNDEEAKETDDENNEHSLVGKVLIRDLIYDANKKQWVNGRMYDPERGMWVNLKVKHVNEDRAIAEGSKFFFSKTVVWEKIY